MKSKLRLDCDLLTTWTQRSSFMGLAVNPLRPPRAPQKFLLLLPRGINRGRGKASNLERSHSKNMAELVLHPDRRNRKRHCKGFHRKPTYWEIPQSVLPTRDDAKFY